MSCSTPQLPYLQKVCIDETANPSYSSDLTAQIDIYSFDETLPTMLYTNIGVVSFIIFAFLLLICFPRLTYFYMVLTFLILLGFSFYLLKSIELRVSDKGVKSGSIFETDEKRNDGLAFGLLACYLVVLPIMLFAPKKLKTAMTVLLELYKYYETMYTVVILTVLVALLGYCFLFLTALLLTNFFTAGDAVSSSDSFFYLYNSIELSNPAVLVLFFIGVYWFFATLLSWHKYLIASSMLQWYFEDGGKLKPISKGLRRAWHHLGSAAIDALLTPL